MRYYWTDERYQITYSKRVSHAVKMVDSCSRVNGVPYIVARKSFESIIAWGVDELHQTFLFEQFFNGKLCCKIHDLLIVPIIFFSGLVCSVPSLDECLININYERFCGVVCVWSRTNSDTIVSMFIWFCYLKWMICGGKLISTSVENFSSWRNSFGPGPHFCQQNKHIPLEKMITWTTCKAVNCFSTVVC